MAFPRTFNIGMGFQIALELIRFVEGMELETMVMIVIGMMITPFILGSLWSLGVAVIWQLITLGFKAGIMLFTVCSIYMTGLKLKSKLNWRKAMTGEGKVFDGFGTPTKEEFQPKCTYLDLVLSVFFQTGLRLPSCVWDPLMEIYLRSGEKKASIVNNMWRKKGLMDARAQCIAVGLDQALRNGFMSSPFVKAYLPNKMSGSRVDDSLVDSFLTEIAEDELRFDLTDDLDTGFIDPMDNSDNNTVFVFETQTEASTTTETVPTTKSTRRRRSGLQAQKRKSSRLAPKNQLF